MREAAIACGIKRWAVAATRGASQSAYTLHFDSAEAEIDIKIGCYQQQLESRGRQRTLGFGSRGFDPETDDGVLFARVYEACELPSSAMITRSEGRIIIYGGSHVSQQGRECASNQLGSARRFSGIDFSDDPPPPAPTVRF